MLCLRTDVITRADIEAVCTSQISNHIFDMLRAVTEKKQQRALDLYYDLLALKEPPMRILYLLARQFNQMLQVKELEKEGYDQSAISKRLGIQPFVVKNYQKILGRYSLGQLKSAVEKCTKTEEQVKTGYLNEALSVELLLVEFSS